jgi:hypothetical protein
MVQTKCKTQISCLICNEWFSEGYTLFFMSEDGFKRYGSICVSCGKKMETFVDKTGTVIHRCK